MSEKMLAGKHAGGIAILESVPVGSIIESNVKVSVCSTGSDSAVYV